MTIEGEGTSEISVFHRLGGSKVKGKGVLKESEWRVKELGNTHLDCSKDDKKTSNDQDIELKSQEKPKENLSSSSKKKRKSSAEKIGARKKAKFTTSVGVQMDNQRQLPEGSSNSLSSASPGPSTLDNTPFTLSSGLQVSLNPRTPRNQRFGLTLNHQLPYEDNLLELSGCGEHIDSSTPKGHILSICPRGCIPQ